MKVIVCWIFLLVSVQAQLAWHNPGQKLHLSPSDTEVTIPYRFENKGREPVKILAVQPGCNCATAELAKKIYKPGESGVIEVNFEVGSRCGNVSKKIKIRTDDPKSDQELSFTVNIPELVRVIPKYLTWREGETDPKELQVTFGPGVELESVTETESFTVKTERLENGAIRFEVMPREKLVRHSEVLRLKTNREEPRWKEIEVHLHVR